MSRLELVCPAGTPAALKAAVKAGGDAVYLGFRDRTNARNFPGLNFSREELADGVSFAHAHGAQVFVAVNSYPDASDPSPWYQAIDDAAACGADAVIIADMGLAAYTAEKWPDLRLHISVQAGAATAESIAYMQKSFNIKRVVLPRVLDLETIAGIIEKTGVEVEIFAFGGLCIMAEGRCALSGYATGISPNKDGTCSPAEHVHYTQEEEATAIRLGDFTINRIPVGEAAPYPTCCKGCYQVPSRDKPVHFFEEPESLNLLPLLPEIAQIGVKALKIEGRQRGKAYVSRVVGAFKTAVDALEAGEEIPADDLRALMEGGTGTTGSY